MKNDSRACPGDDKRGCTWVPRGMTGCFKCLNPRSGRWHFMLYAARANCFTGSVRSCVLFKQWVCAFRLFSMTCSASLLEYISYPLENLKLVCSRAVKSRGNLERLEQIACRQGNILFSICTAMRTDLYRCSTPLEINCIGCLKAPRHADEGAKTLCNGNASPF